MMDKVTGDVKMSKEEIEETKDQITLQKYVVENLKEVLKISEYRVFVAKKELEEAMDKGDTDLADIVTKYKMKFEDISERARLNLEEMEAKAKSLEWDLKEAIENAKKEVTWTKGQIFTFIGGAVRMFAQTVKGLDRNIDSAISLVASTASHIASVAWAASALASSTGNPWLASLHVGIAMQSMYIQTQTLIDREANRANQAYLDDYYDRPF